MARGKVKWFNNAKGYGFIIEDGGSEDLFAHFSSIQMEGYRTLKAGQLVEFEKQPSDKGTHAINIQPLPTSASDQPDNHQENRIAPGENTDQERTVQSREAVSA